MKLNEFLKKVQKDVQYAPDIVHHELIKGVQARFQNIDPPLPECLQNSIHKEGVRQLYIHQAEGLRLARQGRHQVTVTPTASGKTLVYTLAVLERCLKEPDTHALFLFPLKALAQDQLKRFRQYCSIIGDRAPTINIYDGDTPPNVRAQLRENPPNLILTNPDMLHHGILPYHTKWTTFLHGLKYVVIDELHTYKGIFGSHVLQVLRRLRRVASFYHAQPQFLATSATIGNPQELAEKLTGLPFEVVDQNGAPSATRHVFFLNPHGSLYTLATKLFIAAASEGFKTIVFSKARRITELIHQWTVQSAPELAGKISAYRAGYLPSERREIERNLQSGRLLGVISTSALEMGIDIGGLDVCILVGYPGTITATWQRAGRVGRSGQESAIFLIALPDALDQYYMRYPKDFFRRHPEAVVVDEANDYLLKSHLVCAAQEVPLRHDDAIYPYHQHYKTIHALTESGELLEASGGQIWFSNRKQPQRAIDIRGGGQSYTIIDDQSGKIVGYVNGWQALTECHPGAVYLHHGGTFIVSKLDLGTFIAHVQKNIVPYYTQALTEKDTEILEIYQERETSRYKVNLGRLKVTERVVGYERRHSHSREKISEHQIDLPPVIYETIGLWIQPSSVVPKALEAANYHLMGSLHAMEHASLALMPLFALCDRNDLGGISFTHHPGVGGAVVFFYDGHPGGVGLANRAYQVLEELLERVRDLVETCPCEDGCPSCIHSPKCGHGNFPLDKQGCIHLLRHLTGKEELKIPEPEIPTLLSDFPETKRKYFIGASSLESRDFYRITDQNSQYRQEIEEVVDNNNEGMMSRRTKRSYINQLPLIANHDLVVIDVETQLSAAEVGGWGNAHLMRVSLAVLYETLTNDYMIYRENQVPQMIERMQQAKLVVGFNQKQFDYSVLQAYTGEDLRKIRSLDLLDEILTYHGYRVSLGNLATATLGEPKSADGLVSLKWWKEGKIDLIERYCRKDVDLTWRLFCYALEHGSLFHERKGIGSVKLPLELKIKKFL